VGVIAKGKGPKSSRTVRHIATRNEQAVVFAKNLRRFRRERGRTVQSLSRSSKISRTFIRTLEAGQVPLEDISLGIVDALAQGLDVPVSDLVQFEHQLVRRKSGAAPKIEAPKGRGIQRRGESRS